VAKLLANRWLPRKKVAEVLVNQWVNKRLTPDNNQHQDKWLMALWIMPKQRCFWSCDWKRRTQSDAVKWMVVCKHCPSRFLLFYYYGFAFKRNRVLLLTYTLWKAKKKTNWMWKHKQNLGVEVRVQCQHCFCHTATANVRAVLKLALLLKLVRQLKNEKRKVLSSWAF